LVWITPLNVSPPYSYRLLSNRVIRSTQTAHIIANFLAAKIETVLL